MGVMNTFDPISGLDAAHPTAAPARAQKTGSVEAARRWLDQRVKDGVRAATTIAIADAAGMWSSGLATALVQMGFIHEPVTAKLAITGGSVSLKLDCFRASMGDDLELHVYATPDPTDAAKASLHLTPLYAACDVLLSCVADSNDSTADASLTALDAILASPRTSLRRVFLLAEGTAGECAAAAQVLLDKYPNRVRLLDERIDSPNATWRDVMRQLDRDSDSDSDTDSGGDHDSDSEAAASGRNVVSANSSRHAPTAVSVDEEIERLLFETLVRTRASYVSVSSVNQTLMNACEDMDQTEQWQAQDELLRLQLNAIPMSSLRQLVTCSDGLIRCVSAIDRTDGLIAHCIWLSDALEESNATAHTVQLAQALADKLTHSKQDTKGAKHG
jgi:hypothetical protein